VIQQLDQPCTQVLIEVLVVETIKTALDTLAFSAGTPHFGYDTSAGTINYFSLAKSAVGQLTALLTSGNAVLRANPRVVAQEGKEASVEVGTEEYFAIVTGPVNFPYTTLEKVKATISLQITPRVALAKRALTVALEPEVSNVAGEGATGLPIVHVRRAKTEITVGDGQVILIGGLLQTQDKKTHRRIPILCQIPLVGPLFTSRDNSRIETETVIFIVPHLLNEKGEFEGPLLGESIRPPSLPPPNVGLPQPKPAKPEARQSYRRTSDSGGTAVAGVAFGALPASAVFSQAAPAGRGISRPRRGVSAAIRVGSQAVREPEPAVAKAVPAAALRASRSGDLPIVPPPAYRLPVPLE